MSGQFTIAQHLLIKRKSKPAEVDPAEGGELNIVPFLDIVTNVLMFLLATITSIFTASIDVPLPGNPGPSAPGGPPSKILTLKVETDGFIIGGQGGFARSDCASFGKGGEVKAIGMRDGKLDYEGLTRCLVKLRETFPEITEEKRIIISMTGSLPYTVMVQTLDATRETDSGKKDLFTEPAFGVVSVSGH